MHILVPEVTVGYHLEEKNLFRSETSCFFLDLWWAASFGCAHHCCYKTWACFIHPLSFLSLKDFLPPTVSPLACFAFEAGFHSLKLDLVLVLNSNESHSGLHATAAREIQLVRGPHEEIHTLSDSYLLSVAPLLCQVWGFTLSTLLLPRGSLWCQRVVAVVWHQLVMHVVYFLCCVSQLVLPSCHQGFYDVLRRNSQLASSIMETLLSQVKYCSMARLQTP